MFWGLFNDADALLTQPVDREATILPTINDLKRKIILKHKKLSGTNETFTVPDEESECGFADEFHPKTGANYYLTKACCDSSQGIVRRVYPKVQ